MRAAAGHRAPTQRRLALALALLLAFLGQSFVTATHVHFAARPAPAAAPALHAAAVAGGAALSARKPPASDAADCPICREATTAGHYLPAGPAALPRPAALAGWALLPWFVRLARRQRAHIWRSRAPPPLRRQA